MPGPRLAGLAALLDRPAMTGQEICEDPVLRDLPYHIESDRYGRVVLLPLSGFFHANRRAKSCFAWMG